MYLESAYCIPRPRCALRPMECVRQPPIGPLTKWQDIKHFGGSEVSLRRFPAGHSDLGDRERGGASGQAQLGLFPGGHFDFVPCLPSGCGTQGLTSRARQGHFLAPERKLNLE